MEEDLKQILESRIRMGKHYIIGRNPVLELLKSGRKIEKILIEKGKLRGSINAIIDLAKEKNIEVQEVDKSRLERLSDNNPHQGLAALVEEYSYCSIGDILKKAKEREEPPFIIILDKIEDPHNLGAIIRTAESAGAHGLIIPKRRAAQITSTVYKTSAGAVEYTNVAQVNNISRAIEELKKSGLWIYGADMEADKYFFEASLKGPLALVIGSEGKGLSRLVREKCDFLLKIPMLGKISSLNASNAASILIYEVVRQSYE